MEKLEDLEHLKILERLRQESLEFQRLEDFLEDSALLELMNQNEDEGILELDAAKKYYDRLDKTQ